MDGSATLRYKNYEEENCFQFMTKAEKNWNFIEKLQVAKKKLAPIVDEVIQTTTRSDLNNISKLTSSLTSEQYEDVLWASKVFREIKYDFKRNDVFNEKLWKNYKFPNTFIVNNVKVPISAASKGKNVLINETVIAELLDLYQQLGVVIRKISKSESANESKILSSELRSDNTGSKTKVCSCDSIEQLIDNDARTSSDGETDDSISKLVSPNKPKDQTSTANLKLSRSKSLPRDICECPQFRNAEVPRNYCPCKDENVAESKSTHFTVVEDSDKYESSRSRMFSSPIIDSKINAIQSRSNMLLSPEDGDQICDNSENVNTKSGILITPSSGNQSKSIKSFGGNAQSANTRSGMLTSLETLDQSKSTKSFGDTRSGILSSSDSRGHSKSTKFLDDTEEESNGSAIISNKNGYGSGFGKSTTNVSQSKLAKSSTSVRSQKSGTSARPALDRTKSKIFPSDTNNNNNGTIYITIKCFSDMDDNGDENEDFCTPSVTCQDANNKHVHIKLDGQPVTVKVNQESVDGDAVYYINAENDQEENIKIIIKKCPDCYSTVVASSSRIQQVVAEGPKESTSLPDIGDSHESITLHGKSDSNSGDLTLSSDEDTRPGDKSSHEISSNKQMSVLLDVDDLNKSIIEFGDKIEEPQDIDDTISQKSKPSSISVRNPSRISTREMLDSSKTSMNQQPDPSRVSIKSAADPSRIAMEPNTISSSKSVKINTRCFIPLTRRKICSSTEFDVDTVETKLRDGIDHPNPNIVVQLRNLGVNQLLRACRPAKCCRKAILNEKQRTALPYSISLKSLPLDRSDMQIIEQSIDMSMWKVKTPRDLGENNKNQLAYYIGLGQDDFNSSINFPWVVPTYNVNCFELDSDVESDTEERAKSKLSILKKPKHFHLHKSSGSHCLLQQLKPECQYNKGKPQLWKVSERESFSEILPCSCEKNAIKEENCHDKLNKVDGNSNQLRSRQEFTQRSQTKLLDDPTRYNYLNQSTIIEGGDNCSISTFDKKQNFEDYLEVLNEFSEELKQFNNEYEGQKLCKANVMNQKSKSKSCLTKPSPLICTKSSEELRIQSSSVSLFISCRRTSIKLDNNLKNTTLLKYKEAACCSDGVEDYLSVLDSLLHRKEMFSKNPDNNLNYYIDLVKDHFAWNKNVPLITPLIEARFFNYSPDHKPSSPDLNKNTTNLTNRSAVSVKPAKSQYYNYPDKHDDFVQLSDVELARRKFVEIEKDDPPMSQSYPSTTDLAPPSSNVRGGPSSIVFSEVSEPPTPTSSRRKSKRAMDFYKKSPNGSSIIHTKDNTKQPENLGDNLSKTDDQDSAGFKTTNPTGFSFFPNESKSIIFEPWAPHLISNESLPLDMESTQPVEETVGKQDARTAAAVSRQAQKERKNGKSKDKCLGPDGRCRWPTLSNSNVEETAAKLDVEAVEAVPWHPSTEIENRKQNEKCLDPVGRCTAINSRDSDGYGLLCEKKEHGKCLQAPGSKTTPRNDGNIIGPFVHGYNSSTHEFAADKKSQRSSFPKSSQHCSPSIRIEIQKSGPSKLGGLNNDTNSKKCDEMYVSVQKKPCRETCEVLKSTESKSRRSIKESTSKVMTDRSKGGNLVDGPNNDTNSKKYDEVYVSVQKKPCSRETCEVLKSTELKSRRIIEQSTSKVMTYRSKGGNLVNGPKQKQEIEAEIQPKKKISHNKDDHNKITDVEYESTQNKLCSPEICEVYKNTALIRAHQRRSKRDDTNSNQRSHNSSKSHGATEKGAHFRLTNKGSLAILIDNSYVSIQQNRADKIKEGKKGEAERSKR